MQQTSVVDRTSERRSTAKAVVSFAARVAKEHGARPFPQAAQALIRITSEPSFRIDEVVRVIESDPALTSQTLSQVNSAVYARRTRCTSVHQAATLLGSHALRSVATTAGVFSMFDDLSAAPATAVVRHGMLVGAIARRLAPFVGLSPDEMYTCGLLHDVGKLMLLNGNDLDYPELLASHHGFDTLHVAEREEYGFDHAVLAGHVLKAWRIPAPVPRVVGWHHQPERAFAAGGSFARRVALLRLADRASYFLTEVDPNAPALADALADDASLRYLGLSNYALENVRDWLQHEGFEGLGASRSAGKAGAKPTPEPAPAPPPAAEAPPASKAAPADTTPPSEPPAPVAETPPASSNAVAPAAPSSSLMRAMPPPLPPSQHIKAAPDLGATPEAGSVFGEDETDLEAWFNSEPTAEDGIGETVLADPEADENEPASLALAPVDVESEPAPVSAKAEPVAAAATCAQCSKKPGARTCPRCKAALCDAHAPKGKSYCAGCEGSYATHRKLYPFEPLAVCVSASVFLLVGLGIGLWARFQHGPRWERVLGVALPVVLAELALLFAIVGARRAQRTQFFEAHPSQKK